MPPVVAQLVQVLRLKVFINRSRGTPPLGNRFFCPTDHDPDDQSSQEHLGDADARANMALQRAERAFTEQWNEEAM